MKKRKAVLLLALIFLAVSIAQPLLGNAMENEDDLSLTSKLTAELNSEDDLFNSEEVLTFKEQALNIHLEYDVDKKGVLPEGSKLTIELKPENGDTYINYPYKFAKNKSIVTDEGETLADANISSWSVYADITFKEMNKSFKVDINSSLQVDNSKLYKYFEDHPEENAMEQVYYLYINGAKTEKTVKFSFTKPTPPDVELKFSKTNGTYKRKGDLGEGEILYNINIGTKLRKNNEFFIYDTPDINLSFEDKSFMAYYSTGIANLYGDAFFNVNNGWKSVGEGDEEERMEAELYEIYFLTEDSGSLTKPRQAVYEDVTLMLDRYDIINKEQGLDSMEKAAVPKNILLEKPFGEELTAEEKDIIDKAGGLNKTVGKGFKFHIKNFQHPLYEEGGSLILIYNMEIKNPSESLDKDLNPLYYNTASYYAQEIPNCNPEEDDVCTPIKNEQTKLEDIQAGRQTVNTPIKEGQIGAVVDNYSLIDITKENEKAEALAGAEFTIYQSDEEGKKGEVAVNKDNVPLENLLSNSNGKLSVKQEDGSLSPVNLRLKRGYYILSENKAPEGYKEADDYFFVVGFKADPIVVKNIPVKENPEEPGKPGPSDPAKPEDPGNPSKPAVPGKPGNPSKPAVPGNTEKPNKPEQPSPNSKPIAPSNSAQVEQGRANTGDNNTTYLWLGLGSLAACGLALTYRKKLQ